MESRRYATREDIDLFIDIFTPPTSNGVAILLLHGGGLVFGQKEGMHIYAPPLAQRGFTVFAPSYRLLTTSLWPAPLDDIKASIAWVRDHAAEFAIDSDRIVLEGFSAGAMMAFGAAVEQGVVAIVSFFASTHYNPQPGAVGSLGVHLSAEQSAAFAPIRSIRAGFPPTMILHGTADTLVQFDHALRFFTALTEAGVNADLRLYQRHTHEFSMEPSMVVPIQQDVASFLDRAVVAPDRYNEESRRANPFSNSGPRPLRPLHRR